MYAVHSLQIYVLPNHLLKAYYMSNYLCHSTFYRYDNAKLNKIHKFLFPGTYILMK